jgi:hypothetical protein
MEKKVNFLIILTLLKFGICEAQTFIKTQDLFPIHKTDSGSGSLNIIQDPRIDTLLSRDILFNGTFVTSDSTLGIEGFRIQIYSSQARNAREESNNIIAEFVSTFPNVPAYKDFYPPNIFRIRVGDFRSKVEGYKLFLLIQKKFTDSGFVLCVINFPDLNNKQVIHDI